jgi:hypothetical protein
MSALQLVAVDGVVVEQPAMTVEQIDAEVAAIRSELVRPLQRLARLREASAHLTAGFTTWHEACEAWLGDLRDLRLTGSAAALVERRALVESYDEADVPQRVVAERLGISKGSVLGDLKALGRSVDAPKVEALPKPQGTLYEQAVAYLQRADDGLTIAELMHVAGWEWNRASSTLSRLQGAKRLARTMLGVTRNGLSVYVAVEQQS